MAAVMFGRSDWLRGPRGRFRLHVLAQVADDLIQLLLVGLLHLVPDLLAVLAVLRIRLERADRWRPFEITVAVSIRL
jgi:hypothetical protein